jgi:hypothetical protein
LGAMATGIDNDPGWWDRLRRRFAREDSLRLAQPPATQTPPIATPADTAPVTPPPVDTAAQPIGVPVRPPARAPNRPRPDTVPSPPDTTASPVQDATGVAGAGGG